MCWAVGDKGWPCCGAVKAPDRAILRVCEAAAEIGVGVSHGGRRTASAGPMHISGLVQLLKGTCTFATQHHDVLIHRCLPPPTQHTCMRRATLAGWGC